MVREYHGHKSGRLIVQKVSMLLDDSSEWRALRATAVERMGQERKQFHREIKRLLD